MQYRWLISVPVWGDRCVDIFCATALPALEKAILKLNKDARLIVHTDQPDRIKQSATQIIIDARPLPAGLRDFDCLSQAHREVLRIACIHDRVCLLTADMIISEQTLRSCDIALSNDQKLLVAVACMRTNQEGKIGNTSNGKELLTWAWQNRHMMVRESTWPTGHSSDLSRMYFEHNGNVVARWCLPHPLALRIDGRSLKFSPTIDVNLIQNFDIDEIHFETMPEKMAVIELSPRDKHFGLMRITMSDLLSKGELKIGDPMQKKMLEYKVVIVGRPEDCGDNNVIGRILSNGQS